MDVSGQIKGFYWLLGYKSYNFWSRPVQQCDVYAYCGNMVAAVKAHRSSVVVYRGLSQKWRVIGVWRIILMGAWEGLGYNVATTVLPMMWDKFLPISNMSWPDNQQFLWEQSLGDCEASCLNNCSCTAYAYDSRGCSIWTGDLLYLKLLSTYNSNGRTLYLRLAASEIKKQSSVKGKFYIFLFWIIIVAVIIPCAACSVYYLRRKKFVSKQGNHYIHAYTCTTLWKNLWFLRYIYRLLRDFKLSFN